MKGLTGFHLKLTRLSDALRQVKDRLNQMRIPLRAGTERPGLRLCTLQLKVGTSAPETTTTVAPLTGLGKTSAPRVG
jgi:hypothetical protein